MFPIFKIELERIKNGDAIKNIVFVKTMRKNFETSKFTISNKKKAESRSN
jgi:hypothetical protein